MGIGVNQMNLNTAVEIKICQGLTELKLMSLVTRSNSFSYLNNTKMSMMATSGVSKTLMRSVFIMYVKRLKAEASSVKQEKVKKHK